MEVENVGVDICAWLTYGFKERLSKRISVNNEAMSSRVEKGQRVVSS
jgi:hypothetical protein